MARCKSKMNRERLPGQDRGRCTTGTPTKTLLENVIWRYFNFFAIIPVRLTFTIWANYLGSELIGAAFKFKQKMKNSPSCRWLSLCRKLWIWSFHVLVLQKTAKKFTKIRNTRAKRLFYDVPNGVVFVDLKPTKYSIVCFSQTLRGIRGVWTEF